MDYRVERRLSVYIFGFGRALIMHVILRRGSFSSGGRINIAIAKAANTWTWSKVSYQRYGERSIEIRPLARWCRYVDGRRPPTIDAWRWWAKVRWR